MQDIVEFLHPAEIIDTRSIYPGVENQFIWNLSGSGSYSAKSAINALFEGTVESMLWDGWAPLKRKVFSWLAAANRYWMADRLQRHGLPNWGGCPLRDQTAETLSHLLTECPFARQVPSRCRPLVHSQARPSTPGLSKLQHAPGEDKLRGARSLNILTMW